MKVHSLQVRSMLGVEVDVETSAGVYHGMLLSCTASSIWLVDGEDDLMIPLGLVKSIHKTADEASNADELVGSNAA